MMNRRAPVESCTRQVRQQGLQAMLYEGQRDMRDVLHRRVHQVSRDEPGNGHDEIDHADADVRDDIDVAVIQIKGDTLQRLREALVRFDAGEYGCCVECGDRISDKRLQAQPSAIRCTACEEAHEQRAALERQCRAPQRVEWR